MGNGRWEKGARIDSAELTQKPGDSSYGIRVIPQGYESTLQNSSDT